MIQSPTPSRGRNDSARSHQSSVSGPFVDLAQLVSGSSNLTTAQLGEFIRVDQHQRWKCGERPLVEDYQTRFPNLAGDAEVLTDIIYNEFLLREQFGESTELEPFLTRFPDYEGPLRDQITFHLAIRDSAQQTALLEQIGGNGDGDGDGDGEFDENHPELDGYQVEGLIAVGGTSSVYRAQHVRLNRRVAIKLLLHAFPSKEARQRFDREARAIAKLDHENIVDVFDFGEILGRPYLVLEYVAGGPLSDHYRGHAVPNREAAGLLAIVARAIQHCHDRGIVHRDLKPGNILLEARETTETRNNASNGPPPLTNWIPKVTDFGLSKVISDEGEDFQTRTGSIFGTPSYMAPEQANGTASPSCPLVDVYSLGAILYELLTGRPPYQGATPFDVLQQVIREPPIAPSRLTLGLPADIETICLKCLSHDPSRRYGTAGELADDLERFLAGIPIVARRATPVQRWSAWSRRHPTKTAIGVLIALFFAVGCLGVGIHNRRLRQSRIDELVASLRTADTSHVRDTLDTLSQSPDESRRALQAIRNAVPNTVAEFHLDVARFLLGVGDQQELVSYIPWASSAELQLLAELPVTWTPSARESLWEIVLDDQQEGSSRLRAAAALAPTDANDPRWASVSEGIAAALSRELLHDTSQWLKLLEPLGSVLTEPLVSIVHAASQPMSSRLIAASALTEYLHDAPTRLAQIALDADMKVYAALVADLRDDASAVDILQRAFEEPASALPAANAWSASPPVLAYFDHEIQRARRRAAAAITLARLGHVEALNRLFAASPDPTARNHAIERLAGSGLPMRSILGTLVEASDAAVARSYVLALGQYATESLGKGERDELRKAVASLLERFPADSGLLSALDWLDRTGKIGLADLLAKYATSDFDQAIERKTWINQQGQAFVVIIPVACQLGSPQWEEEHEADEPQRPSELYRPFAIARNEATIADMRRWQKDFRVNPRYSRELQDAANNVSFFEAAKYCRWLSELEAVPEDQMCFPPEDKIQPGMILPTDYWDRTGYRLPVEDEWEYACRGGSQVTWPFGLDASLITSHANCGAVMRNRTWPVGTGKPNDYGLFDMTGNVREWCVNLYKQRPEERQFSAASLAVESQGLRVVRGGAFGDIPPSLRSARSNAELPEGRFATNGMRLVRTLPRTKANGK